MPADLVFAAANAEALREIASWDGFRPATFAASEFPVDVLRFERSASPPVVLSRARRAESLKALPVSLRERAQRAFERAERPIPHLALARGGRLDVTEARRSWAWERDPDSFSDGGSSSTGRAVGAPLSRCSRRRRDRRRRRRVHGPRATAKPSRSRRRREDRVLRSSRESGPRATGPCRSTPEGVVAEARAGAPDLVNDVSALATIPKCFQRWSRGAPESC